MTPDKFYHIYNHANGNENLFRNDDNYKYFLSRYAQYINSVADTYAYCLMPNHFHFLIQVKEEDVLIAQNPKGLEKNLEGYVLPNKLEEYIIQQFSNLFNSYTKSFNKVFDRKGALFQQKFKRKEITSDNYYTKLIHYIHANPVHHGFTKSIEEWNYSSYHSLISDKPTHLKREEVLEWYNGKNDFIAFHKQPIEPKLDLEYE